MNDHNVKDDIRELNPEELEEVAGGGVREIVAGVTLAAMTMTGAPVGAFHLASAMAEDAHIQEAPAPETYDIGYDEVMADELEAPAPENDDIGYDEVVADELEAPVEEVTFSLGGDVEGEEVDADAIGLEANEIASTVETNDAGDLLLQVRDALTAHLNEGLDVATARVYEDLSGVASEAAITGALRQILQKMDEEGETPEYYQAYEEVPVEAEAFELTDDAVEKDTVAVASEDRGALISSLIDTTVEARQAEGLYAALDDTFATLAEYAEALANPETGVIDTEGNQIINMTYDALSPRFDNTPEELMGAIGAAVARADEKGYLQALGGDPALVSLAAQETDSKADAATMKYIKGLFDGTLDGIGLAYPGFRPFVPLLKTLSGDIFTIGGNPNAQVLKKLDDIERQIQDAEDSIRRNTYDVVSLQAIGNKYSLVADKAEHIQEKIGNIMGNGALTDAQKLQNVADLLNNSEFGALESAMDGATKCFTSNVNDIFERQSIFDAAYTRACSTVMFSGEAIDISMPYIARQFAVYCAAYGVMNQVYNAYEQVYGFSTLTATRGKMTQRLGGTDIHGKRVGGSVAAAIESYFKGDRYVFVNRGSSNIALDRGIVVWKIKKDEKGFNRDGLNANTGAIPLTAQQVEAICSYAGSRHRSPFDFLFNDMHFAPVVSSKKKLGSDARPIVHIKDIGIGLSIPGKKIVKQKSDPNVIEVDDFTVAYEINEDAQIWKAPANTVCMVDGRQGLGSYTDGGRNKHATINVLYATKEGLKTFDHQMWLAHYYSYKNVWYSERTVDLLLFQGR